MTTETLERISEDAGIQAEIEALTRNHPQFTEALPGVNSDLESGSARALVSTASEIPVWNRETGERSIIIFDSLNARLRQRFPDDHPNAKFRGTRVYTLLEGEAPKAKRGKLACPLSIHGDRQDAEELGYGALICPKPAYFKNQLDVDLHTEKSHRRFWAARNDLRWRREQKESADRQNAILEALIQVQGIKVGGANKVRDLPEAPGPLDEAELTCECGWVPRQDSKNPAASLATHKRMHCKLRAA